MTKLITLGSHLNYSGIAAKKINDQLKLDAQIFFEPSIDSAFKLLKTADYLVLPIENAIDGYIQRTLDLLYKYDYFITHMLELPVNFSLVSQARSLDEIDTIYVQFKAKNQCLDFLEKLPKVKFIITDSNDESLRMHLKNDMNTAAIIPKHFINKPFLLTIHNVHDNLLNHTRFALIEKKVPNLYIKTQVKALLSIRPKIDEVGLLYNLLKHFKTLNINLSSIISRPRMENASPYHFYLEVDTLMSQFEKLKIELESIVALNIKILGVY